MLSTRNIIKPQPLEAKEPWQAGTSIHYLNDWTRIKTLTDFITRSSLLLSSGRHVADVCTFGNRWRGRIKKLNHYM